MDLITFVLAKNSGGGSAIIVDNLLSTETNKALSANMGRVLNNKITSVYTPKGSILFASLPPLISSNKGYVYNIKDNFTTTNEFIEGAGVNYPSGTNVAIIEETPNVYKYDVLSGTIDLSPYQKISDKVTSISSSSTDIQYPSAKSVYTELFKKVDKVSGKELSTNDYDDTEKGKVASAEQTANKVTNIDATSTDIQYPSAKLLYNKLAEKVDKETGKGLSTNDYTNDDKSKLNLAVTSNVTGKKMISITKAEYDALSTKDANTFYNITDDETAISVPEISTNIDADKTSDIKTTSPKAVYTELEKKVNKIDGKGLSTNDYTNDEKTKLNLAVISNVTGKKIISITKSEYDALATKDDNTFYNITDDEITASIPEISTNIEADKTSDIKTVSPKAVYTELEKKVDKVTGKALSTNDYDNIEKSKVASAEQTTNRVTIIDDSSTDNNYPTAKAVKTYVDSRPTDTMTRTQIVNKINETTTMAWTQSGIHSDAFKCTYYGNKWVAGSNSDKGLFYSDDGKTWTQSNITSSNFNCVYYANSKWVAGSLSDKGLYYSTDGITWTQSGIATDSFNCVYYANSKWVVCSRTDKGIYYSTDGVTWTQSNITSGSFNCIYYENGKWVVGSGGTGLYYSTDGVTWTQSNITTGSFNSVYYGGGKWVAGSASNKGIYYSTDGVTWTQSDMDDKYFLCVHYGNGVWVAGCGGYGAQGAYYSTDGVSWNYAYGFSSYGNCVYYGGDKWVLGSGLGGTGLFYSTDGKSWTQSTTTSDSFNFVYYANNIWVSGSDTDNGLYYSEPPTQIKRDNIKNAVTGVNQSYYLWIGTKAEYNAISSKSSYTVYYVTDE